MRAVMLAGAAAAGLALSAPVMAAEGTPHAPSVNWSFNGLFGTFDRGALQRGFQVYTEVCAGCHSLELLSYRNLHAIGFSADQVKEIAAEVEVTDGPNDEGEMYERAGRPSDYFPSPFPNAMAAAASNNGAVPPDLSLMAKARSGGPDYIYALLTGYEEPAGDLEVLEGLSYNAYFPGNQIAMAQPIDDDAVEYADGTEASLDQMSRDVAAFLMWTAEPKLENRKTAGIWVLMFFLFVTGVTYVSKKKIWADLHKDDGAED